MGAARLVAALTPIRARDMLRSTRNSLITAFVAGDLFIVLPALIDASSTLLERHGAARSDADLPDVIVPASFNFPHTGKLLSISFVLFAGWFADALVPVADYPQLALSGLVTFFGSLNAAVPVPARSVSYSGRYVSAVSRDRRDQLAVRDAGRRGAYR